MQVSTKLFNDQQIRQFGKLTADIQQKQEKIASLFDKIQFLAARWRHDDSFESLACSIIP